MGPLIPMLLCAVLGLGWFDYAPPNWELPGRAGFLWAGIGLLIAGCLTLVDRLMRQQILPVFRQHSLVCVALFVLVLVQGLSASSAITPWQGFAEALRTSMIAVYLCLCWLWLPRCVWMVGVLSVFAIGFVILHLLLLSGAILSTEFAEVVTMQALQQDLWALPRYCGWYGNPDGCGTHLLLALGLVQCCPHKRWRLWGSAAATLLICTTFSFATVALGVAGVGLAPLHRFSRVIVALLMVLAALFVLWFAPLRIHIQGQVLLDQQPHSNWYHEGWGETHHPLRSLSFAGVEVEGHVTMDWLLFQRAAQCMLEHPLLGVGGRNFVSECPVKTMDPDGKWRDRSSFHSFYGALMAEHGVLGVMAVLWLVLAFLKGYSWRKELRGLRWMFLSMLVLGFSAGPWFQLATAVMLAYGIEPKIDPSDRNLASTDPPLDEMLKT